MKLIKHITLIGCTFLLVCCFPIETKNPKKAFQYWSRSEVPNEIELIKGQYYQSPHFSLEYELFLKFKSDNTWFNDFVEYNALEIDTVGNDWKRWTKLPNWFNPNQEFLIYTKDQNDEFECSRYFRNPKTGINYIYETLGM